MGWNDMECWVLSCYISIRNPESIRQSLWLKEKFVNLQGTNPLKQKASLIYKTFCQFSGSYSDLKEYVLFFMTKRSD